MCTYISLFVTVRHFVKVWKMLYNYSNRLYLYLDESWHTAEIIYYLAFLVRMVSVSQRFISGCAFPWIILWMASKGIGFYFCDQFQNEHWIAVYDTEKQLWAARDRLTHFSVECKTVCVCVCSCHRGNETGRRRTRRGHGYMPKASWAPDKVGYNVSNHPNSGNTQRLSTVSPHVDSSSYPTVPHVSLTSVWICLDVTVCLCACLLRMRLSKILVKPSRLLIQLIGLIFWIPYWFLINFLCGEKKLYTDF